MDDLNSFYPSWRRWDEEELRMKEEREREKGIKRRGGDSWCQWRDQWLTDSANEISSSHTNTTLSCETTLSGFLRFIFCLCREGALLRLPEGMSLSFTYLSLVF